MESTLEETGKHRVKLAVEVTPEEFRKDLEATYRKVARSVTIRGFRKGKVPRKVIDAQVGRRTVLEQFLRDYLHEYYLQAVREHDLAPIAEPEIDVGDLDESKPLSFTAEVEVRPRLDLDDYKGIKVTRPATAPTDREVDEQLDRLRERFAELEPVERPAARGDYVLLDLRASFHGREVPEATRTDGLYEVGSGHTPKLDEQLEGARKGDILRFNDVLPKDLGEYGGNEVSFTALVKEIKAKRLPEANDEFAKMASEFDTLEDLKADLRAKLTEVAARRADHEVRERVLQALVDRVDVDLPESLVEQETRRRVESATRRANELGMTLERLLENQGWDELRFRADARDHAVRAIKADLVLEAVARKEKIEVTPDEVGKQINALSQLSGRSPKEIAESLSAGGMMSLAGDIIRSKALDLLVENAEIVSEDAT